MRRTVALALALGLTAPALGQDAAPAVAAHDVLVSVNAADLHPKNGRVAPDGSLEVWFEGKQMAGIGEQIAIPGHPEEAWLTVLIKFGEDWTAPGGKLPGLSNTYANHVTEACVSQGRQLHAAGWGGRRPDGCHWSARTHWLGYRRTGVAGGTYIYAITPTNPRDAYGVRQGFSRWFPKGRWFAYVQHVRVNSLHHGDGLVEYWMVDEREAPGGRRVAKVGGIRFRDTDVPQSAINELWADVFCGGTDCGPQPWPRSTLWLKRLTVTRTQPDMAAIEAEVDALNAQSGASSGVSGR